MINSGIEMIINESKCDKNDTSVLVLKFSNNSKWYKILFRVHMLVYNFVISMSLSSVSVLLHPLELVLKCS